MKEPTRHFSTMNPSEVGLSRGMTNMTFRKRPVANDDLLIEHSLLRGEETLVELLVCLTSRDTAKRKVPVPLRRVYEELSGLLTLRDMAF